MRKKLFFSLALLILVLMQGCTPADSLNPLFTDKEIVFDTSLLGRWGGADGYIQFDKADDNGYRIAMGDEKGNETKYAAHLGFLQGHGFLDIVPSDSAGPWSGMPQSELVIANPPGGQPTFTPPVVHLDGQVYLQFAEPVSTEKDTRFKARITKAHWFCKVTPDGLTLHLDCLDKDWIKNHIDDPAMHLAHESQDQGYLLLTASTSDLQKFILAHADDEKTFAWKMKLKRSSTKESTGLPDDEPATQP